MESIVRTLSPEHSCAYLPEERARIEHSWVLHMSPTEYRDAMLAGWRRFGRSLFRPRCAGCRACRSLRVDVARFRPDRSQRRARKANERDVALSIGAPTISLEKLDLYDRYHAYQAGARGWPAHGEEDPASYRESFVDNPFPTQEWCYRLDDELVGVGYVDDLPGGLSAIYFFHDPAHRPRSLGTWNILSLIDEARRRRLPHVYLGYYVADCGSLAYKARFAPNQVLDVDNRSWVDFRP